MRHVSLWGLGLVLGLSACGHTPAATTGAQEPGPKQTELDVAFGHYQAERYDEAAAAFARAYEESGDASALAGQAQSLQQAGQCHEAEVIYEHFLEVESDPTYNNAVRSMIERCTAQ